MKKYADKRRDGELIMKAKRAIIIDLMHNKGATVKQVQHRIKDYSPQEIGRSIVALRDEGHIREVGIGYEVTSSGLGSVYGGWG